MEQSNGTSFSVEGPTNTSIGGNASRGDHHWEIPIMHWFIVSISPLGFVENGVLLWFLCFRMNRNPFTVYITHLSIADISLLFCIFILAVDYALEFELTSGYYYTSTTLSVTFMFGYNTGLYLLTAISVERCLSVLYPIWYRCHRPKHQSAFICALLWVLSCLVTTMEYVMCIEKVDHPEAHCRVVDIFIATLSFLVFTPLMLVSSIILVVKIHKSPGTSQSSKLYLVIMVTVIIFLIFAMPMRFLYLFFSEYWTTFRNLHHFSLLCCTINSSANPCIYFFVGSSRKKRFKESLKVVLTRAFKDETQPRHQDDSGNATVVETVV
ncbi:proto-oncogene Mas [Erinaceus europaeus]|uniref:Proto-oncogene Mas n=1 Tax=Erinaceus europaeus TaxID=9365 RepID=A0A1S3AK97_ERIEU|nr:proto-oncogene Mas [Erinaceus europaeus]